MAEKGEPVTTGAPVREGVVFPAGPDGTSSTLVVNRSVFADAVRAVDPDVAARIDNERDWRNTYIEHIVQLVEIGIRSEENAMTISRDGLASLLSRMQFGREGQTTTVAQAMSTHTEPTLGAVTVRGRSRGPVPEFAVPYRGRVLRGDGLRAQLDAWVDGGIVEPSFAESLRLVMRNRDWLDLDDQTVAVLGAGSEMGPYQQLCQWGAKVLAVDLPGEERWGRILTHARRGRGSITVPVPLIHPMAGRESTGPDDDASLVGIAGADLITQAPEVRTWLAEAEGPLTVGNYVYADGGTNVRVSVAIDAVMTDLQRRHGHLTLAFLATPTDVFSVPWDAVSDARRRYADRTVPGIFEKPVGAVSGGRVFEPHYKHAAYDTHGVPYGVADNLVPRQGPNYALAKRMQRWRASVARSEGATASINIAPPTRTRSVVKNRAFALAYGGMKRFGLEVFDPPASNALMAGMLVHDLRNPHSTAHSDVPLEHPLDLFVMGANHGGMWRCPYEPNSIMEAAAVAGLFEGRA
jgi:hypothetical protein